MSKKKQAKQEWKPTKKHISNLKKQQRKQKIILFSGIGVICVAMVFVLLGLVLQWYIPKVKPLKDVAIEVNGTKFKMNYFIDAVKYQTQGYPAEIIPYFLDSVANNIINGELTRQYADKMGYSVTDKEVDNYLKEHDIKANAAIKDYVHTYLLQTRLIDEHFKSLLPEETELRTAQAMFLESQSQVNEVIERLNNGEDFKEIAKELSLDDSTRETSGDLGKHPAGIIANSELEELVFSHGIGLHSSYDEDKGKKVGYWIIEVLERNDDEIKPLVNARVMLLSSNEEAVAVLEKLESGEDFDKLAEEYSSVWSKETGAFLEEVGPEEISDVFDAYVFSEEQPVNEVSPPIKDDDQSTKGGYWLYNVQAIENGPISEEDASTLSYLALEDWVKEIRDNEDNVIDNKIDDEKKDFALEIITGGKA